MDLMREPRIEEAQVHYYRRRIDELAGDNLRLDYRISTLNHELRQKRQGLALLHKLVETLALKKQMGSVYTSVVYGMKSILGMDHAYVLLPTDDARLFRVAYGASKSAHRDLVVELPEELAGGPGCLLANGAAKSTPCLELARSRLDLPYFAAVSMVHDKKVIGILLAGRQSEQKPHFPALDGGDLDIFRAIAGLIAMQVDRIEKIEKPEPAKRSRHVLEAVRRMLATLKRSISQPLRTQMGKSWNHEVVKKIIERHKRNLNRGSSSGTW